ncbi:MAG: putative rane protein [Microbacteriaceae bacterium]|nr:putative rane protein [Microbacteriaceae bacterium]
MNPTKIIIGLIPFALFAILGNWIPIGWAALVGMAAAIVAILVELRGGVKAVPVVGVIVLGVFAVLGFTGSPEVQHVLAVYGRGLATIVLALYILATVPFAPFTSQFAKASVPREAWKSPRFVTTNRRISLAWGLTVLLTGLCHLLAGAIAVGTPILALALNWGLPIAAILWTVRYTRTVVEGATTKSPAV